MAQLTVDGKSFPFLSVDGNFLGRLTFNPIETLSCLIDLDRKNSITEIFLTHATASNNGVLS